MAELSVCVMGAGGRLGASVVAVAAQSAGVTVSAALERPGSPLLSQPVPGCAPLTYTSEFAGLARCDVVLDASAADAVEQHVRACADAGKPVLVAVTGLSASAREACASAASRVAVCVAPNLSTGVWVLRHLVEKAADVLADYDAEIVEVHHKHKKDAPSGTALLLASAIEGGRKQARPPRVAGRGPGSGVRQVGEIGLASVRGGDVVGDHTVSLFGPGERLELTHRAHSREVFAQGAIRLLALLAQKGPGLWEVPQLLGLD